MTESALDFDKNHIWHPYASMVNPVDTFKVTAADGVSLTLDSGQQLIDGMSSWWSVIHGYNHPQLNKAMHSQIDQFSHVMFGGLTHDPAITLASKLVKMTPAGLDKVFFSDSGSVSVEVAIKMAIQYWHARGKAEKNKMATIRMGYHGDTFGAMAVCDPVTGMHELFTGIMPQHFFADTPAIAFDANWDEKDFLPMKKLLQKNHKEIAAVILEPVVQGAGGMRFYHPEYLKACRQLCDELDVLLIFDEIATGFGRTGKLFACEWAELPTGVVTPDIMCLGKALTGGYMTLAATLTTEHVALTISNEGNGIFMHGPTFMANPLACAAANASISILENSNWQKNIKRIEQHFQQTLLPLKDHERIAYTRVLGTIGVVEMKEPVDLRKITPLFVESGIWVRPFGKLVYLMPPYIIEQKELEILTDNLTRIILNDDIFFPPDTYEI